MVLKEGLTRHCSAIAVFMPELLEAEANSGSKQSVGGPQKLQVPALPASAPAEKVKVRFVLEELRENTRLRKVQQPRRQKLHSEESLDSSVRSELEMLMDFGNIPNGVRHAERVVLTTGASDSTDVTTDASEASSRHTSCGGKEGMEAGEREATSTALSLFAWLSTPWCQAMHSQVPSHALTTSNFLNADVHLAELEDGHVISF